MASNTDEQLTQYVERVERLNEEIKGIQEDRKDVFSEAKSQGYEPKIIRFVIAERALAKEERAERDALRATYLAAIGLD